MGDMIQGEAEEEKEEKVRSSNQGRNLDTGQVLNLSESGTDFPPQYALLGHPDPLPTTFLPAPFDDAGVSRKVPYRRANFQSDIRQLGLVWARVYQRLELGFQSGLV